MTPSRICILGGTGFVGRHLTASLVEIGYHVRIPSRHPHRHRDLAVLPSVQLVNGFSNEQELKNVLDGCDAVINLVGILNEKKDNGKGFWAVHVDLVAQVTQQCKALGIRRYLHMSALNAQPVNNPPGDSSYYLHSKGEGEHIAMTAEDLDTTAFRPSVIFGPGDGFMNRFAQLLKMAPIMPLAAANARFQPVYVGDVVDVMIDALEDDYFIGESIDLCGPKEYTLKELVNYAGELVAAKRPIIPLNDALSALQAAIFEMVPGKPLSKDNLRSLKQDSICDDDCPVCPTALEVVAPLYLGDANIASKYQRKREMARR